jgi:hypothetical protein
MFEKLNRYTVNGGLIYRQKRAQIHQNSKLRGVPHENLQGSKWVSIDKSSFQQ